MANKITRSIYSEVYIDKILRYFLHVRISMKTKLHNVHQGVIICQTYYYDFLLPLRYSIGESPVRCLK